jgi:hypothetical protein
MEIIIVFLVCLLLLNLFRKNKYDDISEVRLTEIRNLISNWYNSLNEFCKITDEHSKLITEYKKDFKSIEKELKNFNLAMENFNLAMDMIPPSDNNNINTIKTSYTNPIIAKLNKKTLKKKFNIIKLKKEKKDDTNN